VTKFAPHKVLKLIAGGKLTVDERVVLHRVGGESPHRVVSPQPRDRPASGLAWDRPASREHSFEDLCLKNGSSQGQKLALAVLFVPKSLDSGGGEDTPAEM